MRKAEPGKAIFGGFIATAVMTMMMYVAPAMGMPKMDIAAMLGSMLGNQMPAPMTGAWWMGLILHLVNGSLIFPLIYSYLLNALLPGANWARGALWGLMLWLLAQVAVMPMMGMGVFSAGTPQPMMSALGSLVGHGIYGAILGAIVGQPAAVEEQGPLHRAA
jgi:uncharacterized membrane protein YagU involved in acid resistance